MRCGEVLGLRWSDLEDGTIYVRQQIYTHVDEAAKRDAITRLNRLLGGSSD